MNNQDLNEKEETINEYEEAISDDQVEDETLKDEAVSPVKYEITSYGADYDVEGLVRRLQRDDIYVPPFQRSFVWTQREASRFIESLLLGLPVPGIFLARDPDTKKFLVIDGQQRLRSLQFFFEGYFNPIPESESQRIFRLINVQDEFDGLTFDTLKAKHQRILNESIIHATIVKQDYPEGEQSSIFHIFERLNTTGRKLSPQQIRVAIYSGRFLELLHSMNEHTTWRSIFGKHSRTLKDQELILRFLALYYNGHSYGENRDLKTMKQFLNAFTAANRHCDESFCDKYTSLFDNTLNIAYTSFGEKVFRLERALNAAIFDSVMVGLAKRLEHGDIEDTEILKARYRELFKDLDYITAISYGTSNERSVERRLKKATDIFADI